MKRCFSILVALSLFAAAQAQTVGSWKAYMAYHDVTEAVQAGQIIYVLASDNLYAYNQHDQSVQTYDKVNLLSDCAIQHIAWSPATQRLIIVYKNQNIDLLTAKQEIINMPDFNMASVVGDKTVNSIFIDDIYAYLATAFGIVKVNIQRAEITDTYNLGFSVNYCYKEDNFLYAAASEQGLYRGKITDNLLDKNNWTRFGDYVDKKQEIDPELLQTIQHANPGGPKHNLFGFMRFQNNTLYTCPAGYTAAKDLKRPGAVQVLINDEWTVYEDDFAQAKLPGIQYVDIMAVDYDPRNNNHVFAAGRTGLYEFNNGKFVNHYSYDNSTLYSVFGNDHNYVIVEAIKFDSKGNLWCFISMADSPNIAVLTTNGEWQSYNISELKDDIGNLDHMQNLITDSRGLFWFVNSTWTCPAVTCFQPSNNAAITFKNFINQDGTTFNITNGVQCVVEDYNHDMWIGTNVGPLLLPKDQITANNPVFTQIKVPRNDGTNYADYLLSGVDIKAIAIDGGNRKWFGTNGNGVYVIDSDNITELHHFTQDNCPLLSNYIESIAINPKTGEIFFGTDKGLCSYMSGAAEGNEQMNDNTVYAYPNPVRPEYNGLITITGLSYNADVKIVTSNGVLVRQGRSTGGMYTWDGCDLKGKRVASGIYMVETATETGKKGTVCKIAIIR